MRIPVEPRIPIDIKSPTFLPHLTKLFRDIATQINGTTEGKIEAVTNAGTAAPTAGKYQQGDFIKNSAPTELGIASSKYVITGWICVTAGEPGTWVECRALTGN